MENYREQLLTGFAVSAGGLGESLVHPTLLLIQTRAASMALADYLDTLPEGQLISILKCFENIIRSNVSNDRVVIPALETVAGLFEESIFSRIEMEYS
jgi:hypothetical protein